MVLRQKLQAKKEQIALEEVRALVCTPRTDQADTCGWDLNWRRRLAWAKGNLCAGLQKQATKPPSS